ncbi:MAG: S8 family serine peptidase [Sphingomonadales bacterium]|jgi:subtilisin family serine protease
MSLVHDEFARDTQWGDRTADFGLVTTRLATSSTPYAALGHPDGTPVSLAPAAPAPPVELLIQFRAGTSAAAQALAIDAAGGTNASVVRSAADGDLMAITLPRGTSADAVIGALSHNPHVSFAETAGTIGVQGVNDPRYTSGSLWGMYGDTTTPTNIYGSQAAEAWARGYTGSMKTVVGVIDTGIDYTHPDLYLNIWLNPGEVPKNLGLVDTDGDGLITFRDLNNVLNAGAVSDLNGNGRIDAGDLLKDPRWANGVDNDGNGRVDDLIGWNFVTNTNDPMDGNGHGTHVSGTIGAIGNNGIGVAGVNSNVQLMALKFLPDSGQGSSAAAVSAIDYYTNAAKAYESGPGHYVGTNNSWGGAGYSQAMLDAITRAAQQDLLFVAAAGNGGADSVGDNNDTTPYWPTNYSTQATAGWDNVISVASITSTGARSGFSNFGRASVDLAAPGSNIVSTTPGGNYAAYSGTSMATPHVTGALALLSSADESLTGAQLKAALLQSVTQTAAMANISVTGGRLDINQLMTVGLAGTVTNPIPPTVPPVSALYGTAASDTIIGTSGDDIISGVPKAGTNLGAGTLDVLTGGGGNDLFVLGDERGRFYDDGRPTTQGYGDYARITDFSAGDRVQLAAGRYFLNPTAATAANQGMRIFFDSNNNGLFDNTDEYVALVQGPKALTMADIIFVGPAAASVDAAGFAPASAQSGIDPASVFAAGGADHGSLASLFAAMPAQGLHLPELHEARVMIA